MKPSEWEPSTGLVSLKYAGEPKTAKTKTPPGLETGLDASDNIHVSSEGRGRIFLLTSLSPKTLSSVNLRDLEAKFGGSFSE
jgi:hypothetical protein